MTVSASPVQSSSCAWKSNVGAVWWGWWPWHRCGHWITHSSLPHVSRNRRFCFLAQLLPNIPINNRELCNIFFFSFWLIESSSYAVVGLENRQCMMVNTKHLSAGGAELYAWQQPAVLTAEPSPGCAAPAPGLQCVAMAGSMGGGVWWDCDKEPSVLLYDALLAYCEVTLTELFPGRSGAPWWKMPVAALLL